MQISDLFDAHRRDEAVRELPDEDLLVAAAILVQNAPPDSMQRSWRAMDLSWYAVHASSEHTVRALVRLGAKHIPESVFVEQYARVTGCPERYYDPYSRQDRIAERLAYIETTKYGRAFLTEAANPAAESFLDGTRVGKVSFLHRLVAYLSDIERLLELLQHERFTDQEAAVRRLVALGASDVVEALASADPHGALGLNPEASLYWTSRAAAKVLAEQRP